MRKREILNYLVASDVALSAGFSIISPIFAIFILDNISGGDLKVVGFATAIFVAVRGVLQIPVGRLLDKLHGNRDEYIFLTTAFIILAISPVLYLIVKTPLQLYLVQFLYAIGYAMNYPAWTSLFTRHIEKEAEGRSWATYSTITDFGGAAAAAISGIIAEKYGFPPIVWITLMLNIIGFITILKLYPHFRSEV
ncbi:MAG: MFS transporter [bacterium]